MADTYTSSLRVRLQADGANDSTWGSLLNTAALQLLEDAIAGRVSVTHDDTANDTLTTANGSTDEARRMIVDISGALSANRNMVVPTQAKFYVIKNSTTGGYSVTVKTTAGSGIAVPNGKTMMLFCDGTNVVESINQVVGNFAVGGTLGVTGATTLSAALTYGGVTLSNAVTGTGNMVLSTSPTLVTPLLGTPTSGVLTNCTGLPIAGTTGYGTGVATALAVNIGSAGAFLTFNGDAGTPSALVGTNITGTAAGLTAGVANAVAGSALTGTSVSLSGGVTQSAFANATTLLTIGGTGASSVFAIPGTLDASGTTGALTVAGGAYFAKAGIFAGALTAASLSTTGAGNIGTNASGSRTGMVGSVRLDVAQVNAKGDADAEQQAAFFGSNDAANPLGLSVGYRSNVTAGSRYVTIDASEVGSAARPLYLQSISGENVYVGLTGTAKGIGFGAVSTNNIISNASGGAGTATLYIGNASINVTSDEWLKSNIRPLADGLSIVNALLPIEYDQDEERPWGDVQHYVGFGARHSHKIAPWSVNTQGDTGLPWKMRQEFLMAPVVKSIQQIDARLRALELNQ